jgi:hypothetical protein
MRDRAPTKTRTEQLLPADDVVLPARNPRDRSLHVMHNLSPARPPADRVRFRITHMHQMTRSPSHATIGRFCT